MDCHGASLITMCLVMRVRMGVAKGVIVVVLMGMIRAGAARPGNWGPQFRQTCRIVPALHPIDANISHDIASAILAHG
jgi:hypothetical protein